MRHARVRRIVCLLSITIGLFPACTRKIIKNPLSASASPSLATGSVPDRGVAAQVTTKDNGTSIGREIQDDRRSAPGSVVSERGNLLGADPRQPLASAGTTGGISSVVISKTPNETAGVAEDVGGRNGSDPKGRRDAARRVALASVVAATLIAAVRWLPKAMGR